MSNTAATSSQTPLVSTQGPVGQETLASLQKNQQLYQWANDDKFPPHVAEVPDSDSKSNFEIFNLTALLQTGGMQASHISAKYLRLVPETPVSLDQLVVHNQLQRAPPGINNNMLFPFNIGDRVNKDWYSDAVFAQQHFTGTNATTITLAKDWITAFQASAEAVKNEEVLKLLRSSPATSFYVQDYSYFRKAMGVADKDVITSGTGRYDVAPVALFHLPDDGKLHPIAIVIDYKGSMAESVVIFNKRLAPGNLVEEAQDWPWRYAKMCVQCADWLRHEIAIHLVNTHLVEEATIVAAHRTISPYHIVYQLLHKHWETTLSLNDQARKGLVPKIILPVAGVTEDQLYAFTKHAYSSFNWTGLYIPKDLESRGFPPAQLKENKFHNYAYARNMAPMWDTIRTFVAAVLTPRYDNNDKLVEDDKWIQAFCTEMRSPQRGKMPSFPEIKTLAQLIDTVTMCIHIASPQHTAVNYLQQYYQVFVPNKPWALYSSPPKSLDELQTYKEQQLLDALPFNEPRDWLYGAQLPYMLSFEVLGQNSLLSYARDQFNSPISEIRNAARSFEQNLIRLQDDFKEHSNELDDKETIYSVMDPAVTAVSILI
ncbi:unnamed protein product [Rhizoctonia solani]|uniref:Manganese lipoxygenase n=1 Tax=Rhizoctonia solani TaxID=456999 RepID=A0A8H3HR99_9AGAM|nr:unnamed protein product [Rhizoctonia solani]